MYTTIKQRFTRWVGILVCAVMLAGGLLTGMPTASAAAVNAVVSPDIIVKVDGQVRTFFTVNGVQAHPILYNGTTYLPLRAIGELMNRNVNWDQSTFTVTLSGTRTTPATTGTPDVNPTQQNIQVEIHPDFTIVVDGMPRTFADAQGNRVYPMLYSGTTYLPLRAIGELMGKTVSWDPVTHTASLSNGSSNGNLVTDADSFGQISGPSQPRPQPSTPGTGSYIGEAKAKTIALNHAGLAENQVTFIKALLDYDDGRMVYDVEFYTPSYQEYDYEIDALTGAILEFDYDVESWSAPQQGTTTSNIGIEKAKTIALNRAGLNASQVTFVKAQLDYDDGRWEYEIEFISGTWEYEFEIDAYSGAVRSYERDSLYD